AVELEGRLEQAQARLAAAREVAPVAVPHPPRDALLSQWNSERARFSAAREELDRAVAELRRLRAGPEPSHGVVPPETRRQALQADPALQQDLRELEVNLAELKHHLRAAWQKSVGPLENLHAAVNDLAQVIPDDDATGEPVQRSVKQLSAATESYRGLLTAFTETWDDEFVTLQNTAVDSLSTELADTHDRVRKRLNDFLFESGKHLTTMRKAVQAIGEDSGDLARYHVLQSNLIRGFRILQGHHHRFEFSAGMTDARQNFQIDAALRGARGLHRRTQQRTELIDARLQKQAVRRARQQRIQDVARAEQDIDRLRSTADETVVGLIALQEQLNNNANLVEELLRANQQVAAAESRVTAIEAELAAIRSRLAVLAGERMSDTEDARLELIECRVIGSSVQVRERLAFGAFGTVVTLFGVAVGRLWLSRRSSVARVPPGGGAE
ncbi:MAG: hypothetical protein JSU86_07505, partial [Phycisphaerales bacterium]